MPPAASHFLGRLGRGYGGALRALDADGFRQGFVFRVYGYLIVNGGVARAGNVSRLEIFTIFYLELPGKTARWIEKVSRFSLLILRILEELFSKEKLNHPIWVDCHRLLLNVTYFGQFDFRTI